MVIKRLDTFTFLVKDLLDNKEKEMRLSGKQAMNFFLKENEIVYAGYSAYTTDKSTIKFYTGTDFKLFGTMTIFKHKDFLDNHLPVEAKYA